MSGPRRGVALGQMATYHLTCRHPDKGLPTPVRGNKTLDTNMVHMDSHVAAYSVTEKCTFIIVYLSEYLAVGCGTLADTLLS